MQSCEKVMKYSPFCWVKVEMKNNWHLAFINVILHSNDGIKSNQTDLSIRKISNKKNENVYKLVKRCKFAMTHISKSLRIASKEI